MEKDKVNNLQQPYYYEDDEIDLYELWLILKKRKKVIFISVLFFLIIGILYCAFTLPTYRATHVFRKTEISIGVFKSLTNQLEEKLKNKDYIALAKLINCSPEEAKTLSSISIESSRKSKDLFTLTIEGYNPTTFKNIDKNIESFFKSSPVVRENLNAEKELLLQQLKDYSSKLNSLQKEANLLKKKILKGNIKTLGFNPLDIDNSILEIKAKISELNYKLQNLKPFETVTFYVSDKPVKPKKELVIAVSIITGLFIGIFLAFFFEWLENVRKRYSEERN
jgi:sulfur relay (sulfurtransferase) DsrF/TusC family protein